MYSTLVNAELKGALGFKITDCMKYNGTLFKGVRSAIAI
jgi:hypothetical protein